MKSPISPPRAKGRNWSGIWAWTSVPILLLLAVLVVCWSLTEPLEDSRATTLPGASTARIPSAPLAEATTSRPAPEWPEGVLEGQPAKELLLEILLAADRRLEAVDGYTATFRKQERIGGRLGDGQTMEMKVKHRPFAIYLKFIEPEAGKEVVYAEGRHDNKVIAHSGGWARRLVPRLAVPPTHPLAMANCRHPINEAGLARLTKKLIHYRRMDLEDPDAGTILDRVTTQDGRNLLRSIHTHSIRTDERPFAHVEVLYDPETKIPVQISSFDWPEPDHSGDLLLAERYTYDDLDLDAELDDLDFDPANPDYAFHRF